MATFSPFLSRNQPGRFGNEPLTYGQYVRQATARGALQGEPQNFADLVGAAGSLQSGYREYSSRLNNPLLNLPSRTNTQPDFSLVQLNKDTTGQFDSIRNQLMNRIASASPNYSGVKSATTNILASLGVDGGGSGGGSATPGAISPMTKLGRFGPRGATGAIGPTGQTGAIAPAAPIDGNAQVRSEADTFIGNLRNLQPQLRATDTQQGNALNRVFTGDYQSELARNTQAAADAERRLAGRAIQGALLQGRMGSAGGVGSSYVNAQIGDAVGRIAAETAARDADRRRQDTAALLAAQQANAGRSQDLATRTLMLDTLPIDVRNAILDNEMRRTLQQDVLANTAVNRDLQRLNAVGQAVNIDQATDELATIGRKLGLSGQALQQYLASNMFGVQRNGEDYPLYIPGLPGRQNSPGASFPNYTPPQSPSFLSGLPSFNPSGVGGRARTPAEQAYFANAGIYPDQDPNFSRELWNYSQGAAQRAAYYSQPRAAYYDQPEGPQPAYTGPGYGYYEQPNGSYEIVGNFDYSNPNTPLYYPGANPEYARPDYVSPYE